MIEVWRCNWQTVEIYRNCQLTYAGMSGCCIGLSGIEIRAVLELMRIPRRKWRRITRDLQIMSAAAAQYINGEAKKASKKKAT